ncbi:MAG: adenosylcobalamin-dependent ribonucleoside-diphosphate reductase [Deltaproteobacteria bacterium]|nr:MAG: adenosylcobalamin-dependent ribonucleoside-diphosphate reductase [Deltaproteobacteria bacterium]
MALSRNALAVLRRRYLRPGETPDDLFRRVAATIRAAEARLPDPPADADAFADRLRARMAAGELLPNSPALMNAGRPDGQLAACFVVPVEDDTAAIFDAIKWAAMIQRTGGGTGFSFSRLRPAGDPVGDGGVAAGPVAFMEAFDRATAAIAQGGVRRGANMGVLRVDHPDILDFVTVKLDPDRMRNFNLSVAATDAFMAAVDRGERYALRNPRTGAVVRELDARRVFQLIADVAWQCGDPGMLFIDRIEAANPTPALGRIEATNPCGEQPLLPFEACVLGSVNLSAFVRDGSVDEAALAAAVRDGVRMLDDLIDASAFPLPQIEAITRANRKIGLGVMGWADLLIALGIPYDDDEALALADRVGALVERESLAMSERLAEARGPFSNWPQSTWAGTRRLRNATTTTVAPTGTISILAGCSSGIEPLYAVAYERHVLDGEVLDEMHPAFERIARARGFWSDALRDAVRARGRVRGLDGVPADVQRLFATAHDVAPERHVQMQAVFQRYSHSGVSKTVNLPRDAPPEAVARAYRLAYELGCKGITVYRDGSRAGQVLAYGRGGATGGEGDAERCPECGGAVRRAGGCVACRQCGWSACA